MATEVFKGDLHYLNSKNVKLEIDEATEYLLVAKKNGGKVSDVIYPLTPIEQLSKETIDIPPALPCYDELVAKEYVDKSCTKHFDPVCGSNNMDYGNIYEMRRHGIIIFRSGR